MEDLPSEEEVKEVKFVLLIEVSQILGRDPPLQSLSMKIKEESQLSKVRIPY